MDSIGSSGPLDALKTGARAAVEGAVVVVIGVFVASRFFSVKTIMAGIVLGSVWALAASLVSLLWFLWAQGRGNNAFWAAFGGGMALRFGILLGLACWGYRREMISLNALLISYAAALIVLLPGLEIKYLRLK